MDEKLSEGPSKQENEQIWHSKNQTYWSEYLISRQT